MTIYGNLWVGVFEREGFVCWFKQVENIHAC